MNSDTVYAILGGIVRTALAGIGAGAFLTGDQISSVAGAVAVILVAGWSAWQKYRATKDSHAQLTNAVNTVAANPTPQNAQAVISAAKAGKF
jgi:hypothetical protein